MTPRPRTVVLGGTGYIGAELLAALGADAGRTGEEVVAVGRRAPDRPDPQGRTTTVRCDLSRPGSTTRVVQGADTVVHLVAHTDPTSSWRGSDGATEIRVLREVLATAAHADAPPRVLLASTLAPSPPSPEPSEHERTKRALEDLLADAVADRRVRGAALRLGTVHGLGAGGPGRGLVATLVGRALAGEPLTVWRGAEVTRTLVHVRDVAAAFVRAARLGDGADGAVWPVPGADELPVPRVAEIVAEEVGAATGRPVPVELVPPPPWAVAADFRDVRADGDPFRRATGWQPRTTLRAGVRDLIAHARAAA